MSRPFSFIELPPTRSDIKPRRTGQTMMIDMGLSPEYLKDYLRVNGHYIDIAKIFVGSARLYDESVLQEKAKVYEAHNIETFLGGQFLEYVFHRYGWSAVPKYFAEAARLNMAAIEVSDNCIHLSDEDRCRLIQQAVAAGLRVHGEVGSKNEKVDVEQMVAQARIALEAGADMVLFEAAELVNDGVANEAILDRIRAAFTPEQIMIELPGPWIAGVSLNDVFNMMVSVTRGFGADANIGNVASDQVLNLEALRCEIGIVGPGTLP